jgi:branched-chain amino acid transport system substrate-binding protein
MAFAPTRGPFRHGSNHFPIPNFYLQDVVKGADGTFQTVAKIAKDDQDIFRDNCI